VTWSLLVALVAASGLALASAIARQRELLRMRATVRERREAEKAEGAGARLQHPVVDLSRCLGCATCVAACPEDDVLELVHGQAMVVNGSHCVGISACERECPVGAITVTLGDLSGRDDVPVLDDGLEAAGSPGLFLAGEVTAHALIKTAVDHGVAVAAEVDRREEARRGGAGGAGADGDEGVLDLCIVGAGPAGLACSLEAKRRGLAFVTLEREVGLGGTVARYPRRKLVTSQAIELPLFGRLGAAAYSKEEVMALWASLAAEHELPIRGGCVFQGLERLEDGSFRVDTSEGSFHARQVCLAIGRRGTPRRLEVPGEELPKVSYSLLDAHSYQGRRVLVVGGGDSAVESALALAEQEGNDVTLSYRGESFFRIRGRNRERLEAARADGRLRVLFRSEVRSIDEGEVRLDVGPAGVAGVDGVAGVAGVAGVDGARAGGGREALTLANDDVFVMAGGVPPFELLGRSGVSFDGHDRPSGAPVVERGSGLVPALKIAFGLSLVALLWALWHADYYRLPADARPAHPKHAYLRPGLGLGLFFGCAAAGLVLVNLAYLARRSPTIGLRFGSLSTWMTSHVATGVLAFLCATLHAAMAPRDTVGGDAYWALALLLATGAVGRYFYAYVPRAANGRELELDEVERALAALSGEWDQGQRRYRERVRREVEELVDARQWGGSFLGRVGALLGGQRDLHRVLGRLKRAGESEGVAPDQVRETLRLARRAHRAALMAAHFEDLRALLGTWRYLHRWGTALMLLFVVLHVLYALTYGQFFRGGA